MSSLDDLPFPKELAEHVTVCNTCARGQDCEKHRFKGFPTESRASVRCRHCAKQIKSFIDYRGATAWTHEDEMIGRWCRTTAAAPTPSACGQCGWVGVGDCPRGPGEHS